VADAVNEILKRILDVLKGADLWIALSFLVVGFICWRLIGAAKREKKVLRRQIGAALILAFLAGSAILATHFFFRREQVFPKNVTGILVTRIAGDEEHDSLQGELVANLNAQLEEEPAGQRIVVHASAETVEESKGLAAAHKRARLIGQRLNAKLVIWGRKIGEKKFYPRITVVAAPEGWAAETKRTHDVQSITELHLPDGLTDEPFYLIRFAAGYSYANQNNYREALRQFKAALQRKGSSASELADLQFFTAFCDYSLSFGQRDMTVSLEEAIGLFEKAAKVYKEADQKKWAMTQNNLGAAYGHLPTGDRAANLQKAIAAYEAALKVYTEKDFPTDWAMTQNNLGAAYSDLPTGDRAANLQKAIAAYEAALKVYAEKDFTIVWAATQNNLGAAYSDLPTGDRAANLQKAIAAYETALRVYTEKDFPIAWAMTQNNLGAAYGHLPTGDRAANLQKAIAAYETALRVRTEKDFPTDWATTHRNLGILYAGIIGRNRRENLEKAKVCFEAALKVYTESGFPEEHRDVAARLGDVEQELRKLTPR
jgi:tetratricopeptide (TPR) repeat protein